MVLLAEATHYYWTGKGAIARVADVLMRHHVKRERHDKIIQALEHSFKGLRAANEVLPGRCCLGLELDVIISTRFRIVVGAPCPND